MTISLGSDRANFSQKIQAFKDQWASSLPSLDFPSDFQAFNCPAFENRHRCEFSIQRGIIGTFPDGNFTPLTSPLVDQFDLAASIRLCLLQVLSHTKLHPELCRGARSLRLNANAHGQGIVTIVYHREVTPQSKASWQSVAWPSDYTVILRWSQHQELLHGSSEYLSQDWKLLKHAGKLRHDDYSFFQSHPFFPVALSHWLQRRLAKYAPTIAEEYLLECYCGIGSLTLPASKLFKGVVATENNRSAVKHLEHNLADNAIDNVQFARLSAGEVSDDLIGQEARKRFAVVRQHYRDQGLTELSFSTLLVDPPRVGLEPKMLEMAQQANRIIYISCNPNSFLNDLEKLSSFRVEALSAYNQFAYTKHYEMAAVLTNTQKPSRGLHLLTAKTQDQTNLIRQVKG